MTGRTKVVAGAVVSIVLAAGAIAVYFHPIDVNYRLWRYRRDPDGFKLHTPQLCTTGNRAKPAIYEAFGKHGKSTDVAAFRVAIAATLRCLRDRDGREQDVAYQDLPEDKQLFDTIIAAVNQEPDQDRRFDMLTDMWRLDFRAAFTIYVGILAGPNPIPISRNDIPAVDPDDHAGKRGPERDQEIAVRRTEWCRVISPAIQRAWLGTGDVAARRATLVEIGRAACSSADLRWLGEIAISSNTTYAELATEVLAAAVRRSVPYARDILVSLFGTTSETCNERLDLFGTLARTEEGLDRETAIAIVDRAEHCLTTKGCDAGPQPPCRDELIARLVR